MGQVFLVRHVELGVERALKVMSGLADAEALLRFQREGEAQARLDHPHVARIHDLRTHSGRLTIALDLLPGGDLQARLSEPLSADDAVALLTKLAAGLSHAHAQGVLHRDLKPANVMFDAEDEPKLVDFGLAKVAGAESLTQSGTVMGSPQYMAPEQAAGDPTDVRTDVYGLGAILYHCLTGRPPHVAGATFAVLLKALESEPTPIRDLNPDVPEWLVAVCRQAMARAPERRYPTVDAFAAALESSVAPRPLRSWWLVSLGLLLVAAALIAMASRSSLSPRPPPTPTSAASAPGPLPSEKVSPSPSPARTWEAGTLSLPRDSWEVLAFCGDAYLALWSDHQVWVRDLRKGRTLDRVAWNYEQRPRAAVRLPDGSLIGASVNTNLRHYVDPRRASVTWGSGSRLGYAEGGSVVLGSRSAVQVGRVTVGPKGLGLEGLSTLPLSLNRRKGQADLIDAVAIGGGHAAVAVHKENTEAQGRYAVLRVGPPHRFVRPLTPLVRVKSLAFAPGTSDLFLNSDRNLWILRAENDYAPSDRLGVVDPSVPSIGKQLHLNSVAAQAFDPSGKVLYTVPQQGDALRAWGREPPRQIRWAGVSGFDLLACAPSGRVAFVYRDATGGQHLRLTHVTHLAPKWEPIEQGQ